MAVQNPSRRARRTLALPLLAASTIIAVTACGSEDSTSDPALDVDAGQVDEVVDSAVSEVDASSDDLAQTLRDNGLDSVAGVVEQIDVSEWIGDGDFTFFAPNNEAFLGLDAEQAADLLTDPARILDVLQNHTLATTVLADELVTMQTIETQQDATLAVTATADEVRIDDVAVVTTDIEAGGGVIHVVDGLLLP